MQPNILMITVDDMNYNSPDFLREDDLVLTPHLNRLKEEGCFFSQAHVNVGVCQPSRQCIMTGKLPHNNGSHGFEPISEEITTLQEILKDQGYMNGIVGKVSHLAPVHKYCWDEVLDVFKEEHSWGRCGEVYHAFCKAFLENRKQDGAPFFLMANSHDPHRPFAGSVQELNQFKKHLPVPGTILPEQIQVPGFLPDIPKVREEVAQYYTSVKRCDQTIGRILDALEETGMKENTLVIFLSDNGMAFPFAKTNCYENGTKTPLIMRWPEIIKAGSIDDEHLVSGVDIMPTLLEILGVDTTGEYFDGKSFYRVLQGEFIEGFEKAFTLFNKTSARRVYEMRCVEDKNYSYIRNYWSDGDNAFQNESMSGLSFKAMKEAAEADEVIQKRVNMFLYREREEFYQTNIDPDALTNLIYDTKYADKIEEMRRYLHQEMIRTNDPLKEME